MKDHESEMKACCKWTKAQKSKGQGLWEERDKAEYERNKQFEKLTEVIVAMKEKMEKM